uniref:Uncharacterized protein n=1 Tax=Arundo donax TaxID=35708 RepID=A0A0A9BNV2_ARUDO
MLCCKKATTFSHGPTCQPLWHVRCGPTCQQWVCYESCRFLQ